MRQFIFGLAVAGLAWWGYGHWVAGTPAAAGSGQTTGDQIAEDQIGDRGGSLRDMLGSGADTIDPVAGSAPIRAAAAGVDGAPAAASPAGDLTTDLADLLPRVAAGDPEAIATAWAAVASARLGVEHDRVVAALTPRGDDFAARLAALGNDNSFLHSAAGRDAAEKALAAGMALSDDQAIAAGSQLLFMMTRGRLDKADTTARAAVDLAYDQHRIRVDRWLCNPANVAGARSYAVASGDSLDRIAARFRREGLLVESGTIAVLNRVHNPKALQVGQKLKVPMAPIVAVVEKRSFAMMVFVGDQLLRLYWVGHGENDCTPVTEFEVVAKQPRPEWTAPDGNVYPYGHPKNILGEYFIKFQHPQYAGFGAHGTPFPDTIGTMSSMGCIRMKALDIAELFKILPRGAKVVIRSTESLGR